jgi:glucose/arabinose dehydrogenase
MPHALGRLLPLCFMALLLALEHPAMLGATRQAPSLPPGFTQSLVVDGLNDPITMEFAPDGRLFVVEKSGWVRVVQNGELLAAPFLDLDVDTFSDRGLLGLSLDPSFAENGYIYVFYSRPGRPGRNRVSRFTASATNRNVVEAASERVLLDDIPADVGNHNGGAIHFGTDGKLYIGVGDGAANPRGAQSVGTLNGKILRLNPDGSIPVDNPFVAEPEARPEIWAYGLRNPFSFAVQPGTGLIFINDVGAGLWEEIDVGVAGANYGWPSCEGVCAQPEMVDPIHVYTHDIGCAITGGVFYNGGQFPADYNGAYFFADYMGGWIRVLTPDRGEARPFALGVPSPVDLQIGNDGALYYLSFGGGAIYRIEYQGQVGEPTAAGEPATPTFLCVE